MHRSLGVGVSKIRSAELDDCWSEVLVDMINCIGSVTSNEFWEGNLGTGERPLYVLIAMLMWLIVML